MNKRKRILLGLAAVSLLVVALLMAIPRPAHAVPAVGLHKYYSDATYTVQVGQLRVFCNFTTSGWGVLTNYEKYTPTSCDV
ncbi:MAG TPA: DUF6289 family protein [Thermoanaerobaculia bacterium]|nr:DUF6289 family protein [Thermoanaerobaculia bacterium]